MAYRFYRADEIAFVRCTILEPCSDVYRNAVASIRIEDFPVGSLVVTTFAPLSELARADDLGRLVALPAR